jgi:hypothetical protein
MIDFYSQHLPIAARVWLAITTPLLKARVLKRSKSVLLLLETSELVLIALQKKKKKKKLKT